jgi:alkanesulfonate monooxygenase SsuD/methylene tetrahydromethanopterin reductase-like flavin-dependent oxidoreductase (luciferase family)
MDRLGLNTGKPLADIRAYVEGLRSAERPAGGLPPIWLAALRDKMLHLAVEIAEGAIWANAAFSHMKDQLSTIADDKLESFSLLNMAPTVIDADKDAARAIHRRTLSGYVILPNYRNYWKAAGYEDEMAAIEDALAAGDRDKLPSLMTDAWVDDCTISGSAGEVRERLDAWFDLGVTPIAVMSSTTGGQAHAIGQLFELYS